MPFWVKWLIVHFSTCTAPAARTLIPESPVPRPSMSSPRRTTTSVLKALMMMALVPETRTPASKPSDEMVIDLVMVTPPKPPGSRTLISPPAAVFEMAPAKVLQGAVRLHGLASSPTPETQVRVACEKAGHENAKNASARKIAANLPIRPPDSTG